MGAPVKPIAKDVDAYIAAAPEGARPLLAQLRELVKVTVPGAREGISYGVPFYQYHGQFVGFKAFKNHVSFGYGAGVLQAQGEKALKEKGYKLGKGTLQIRFDQAVPVEEVRRILRDKARQNEAKYPDK